MSYFNMAGEPITVDEWIGTERRVALDELDGGRVSTILLGLDHSTSGGRPQLFETMVFDGVLDGECWRYPTLDDARAGHARVVALVKGES